MNQTMFFDVPANPSHPAKYTDILLPVMAGMLRGRKRILDPFGGTGKVFLLEHWLGADVEIQAVEIEAHVAAINPRTKVGNALALPWPDGYFDAVNTSPTYGNRMGDHHDAKDASKRRTYRHMFGQDLHPDNSGAMQWGPKYRAFHVAAWTEARRVLQPGAAFVLNCKDHYRTLKKGEPSVLQPVTDWHISALESLGFRLLRHERVPTPSMRYGANADKRVEYESVILFELEAAR